MNPLPSSFPAVRRLRVPFRWSSVAIVCYALLLTSFGMSSELRQQKLVLPIAGDVQPQTPEFDQLEVRLVLGANGWKIAAIGSSIPGTRTLQQGGMPQSLPFVSPLRFVLSDIDADSDPDVIVVHRLSGHAHSVWRNNGDGPFERLRGNHYGKLAFLEERIAPHEVSSSARWLSATSGSIVRTNPSFVAAPLVKVERSLRELHPLRHNHLPGCAAGRAPPAHNLLS